MPQDSTSTRLDARSLTISELEAELSGLGKERYRALQVWKWLWQRGVSSFHEMTNISKATRAALQERMTIPWLRLDAVRASEDGTRKLAWLCQDGARIESVLIPEQRRLTLCISTQVGCAMGCAFCLTGDMGLVRHLRPSEIACQVLQAGRLVEGGRRITNIVVMGMGEPLHNLDNLLTALRIVLDENALNYSHRKVTVSTAGLVPQMLRLGATLPVNLAVSLNATTDEQRRAVMPIARRWSLAELLDACRRFPLPPGKRITFEYVMMAGFNDSDLDAERLVGLLRGIPSKVNLIPYNQNPARRMRRPRDERVEAFRSRLARAGLSCSLRATRGTDISAACGQLGRAPA